MDLLELVDILALGSTEQKTSYATPLKLLALGKVMGLDRDTRVIDYGCGRGEALILWATYFGITGIGVEKSERFCDIAAARIQDKGLAGQVQVVCADAATYPIEEHAYDVACCIGAPFIWGGFGPTLRVLKQVAKPDGQIVVGDLYYTQRDVPPELLAFESEGHTELELLHMMHEEGLALKQIFRASSDDRDWYTARWSQHGQEMYLKYMRAYHGWAMYLMQPEDVGQSFDV